MQPLLPLCSSLSNSFGVTTSVRVKVSGGIALLVGVESVFAWRGRRGENTQGGVISRGKRLATLRGKYAPLAAGSNPAPRLGG